MAIDEDKRATLRRFAAIGAASPLAAAAGHSQAESEVREAILGYVAATPGAHFSKLRDDLKLGTGEAQHHLRRLSEAGAIEVARDGDYKRFFPADRFDEFEKVSLGYLRRETPRSMLIELLRDPDITGAALAAEIGVSQASVSTYAAELEQNGLLDRDGGYAVTRPETVVTLVLRYAESFDRQSVEFAGEAADLLRYDP
jgi:predicted transcriptional regulator